MPDPDARLPTLPGPAADRPAPPATPSDLAAAGYRATADAPDTVGAYLAALAPRYRLATLRRRLAALARAHRTAGHRLDTGHPAIRETLRGIARRHGAPQRRSAAAPRWPPPRSARWSPPAAATSPGCATGRCCCSATPRRCAGPNSPPWRPNTCASPPTGWSCCCRAPRATPRAVLSGLAPTDLFGWPRHRW